MSQGKIIAFQRLDIKEYSENVLEVLFHVKGAQLLFVELIGITPSCTLTLEMARLYFIQVGGGVVSG